MTWQGRAWQCEIGLGTAWLGEQGMGIKQDYIEELNRVANRYGAMEDGAIKNALSLLKDLRSRIGAQLVTAEGWEPWRLKQLREGIERAIAQFQAQASADVQGSFRQAVLDGGESVVDPFRAAGFEGMFFQPSTAQINVATDFSARLIQQISDEIRGKVDRQLQLAVLGDKSPLATMKGITQDLGIEARTGVWKKRHDPVKGVAARAETILRTEMQRQFNLATYSQQQEQAQRVPGLTKSWLATADMKTRPTHLRAHVKYKANPIPIDQPFEVGTAKLMYPGDPNGPPEETINCRCRSITHHPAIGRVGSSLDARIAKEVKRRAA